MALSLTDSFGVFERALELRALRAEVLGNNIANADTPGYKARDLDFAEAMRGRAPGAAARRLGTTQPGHHPGGGRWSAVELGFRVPLQPSLDQNTVETHIEQAAFTDNAVRYQATLTLLNGRIRHLMTAITGQ